MTQTIEATGKLWKLIQLVGTIGILTAVSIGIAACFVDDVGSQATGIGVASLILSLPCYVVGRVGAWWFHG